MKGRWKGRARIGLGDGGESGRCDVVGKEELEGKRGKAERRDFGAMGSMDGVEDL